MRPTASAARGLSCPRSVRYRYPPHTYALRVVPGSLYRLGGTPLQAKADDVSWKLASKWRDHDRARLLDHQVPPCRHPERSLPSVRLRERPVAPAGRGSPPGGLRGERRRRRAVRCRLSDAVHAACPRALGLSPGPPQDAAGCGRRRMALAILPSWPGRACAGVVVLGPSEVMGPSGMHRQLDTGWPAGLPRHRIEATRCGSPASTYSAQPPRRVLSFSFPPQLLNSSCPMVLILPES